MPKTPKLPSRYKSVGDGACGGFSDVMYCTDTHLDRKVAIKFVQDESEKRRILDELRALLQMRSKHVVQVYDIIPDVAGNFGIVEEFIGGEDLWTSVFPCQSLDNYLKTLWQVASGIADIQATGIIHRDIKPNNIKLDAEGVVKIFDFGLARDEGPDAATQGFKGTRGFAAPELFRTGTVAFSNAIDTYAFGATAIFLANQSHSLPQELLHLPPQSLATGFFAELPIGIPTNLCGLLEQCLATNPDDRPAMQTMRDEIARYLLRGRHQALAVYNGKASSLHSGNKTIRLEFPTVGKIEIVYDGFWFRVTVVDGEVFVNNSPARAGMELPGSCVIALGASHRKANQRAFIAFDISNPEVVL